MGIPEPSPSEQCVLDGDVSGSTYKLEPKLFHGTTMSESVITILTSLKPDVHKFRLPRWRKVEEPVVKILWKTMYFNGCGESLDDIEDAEGRQFVRIFSPNKYIS